MKTVAIRCDASVEIGTGHLMRCLTLANQLKKAGADIIFIGSNISAPLSKVITQIGYFYSDIQCNSVTWSQERDAESTTNAVNTVFNGKIDWVIVDHYQLDSVWERKIRTLAKRVMVIDDLANRRHDCDVLLDQNFYKNMSVRYEGLLPENCLTLIGPKYLLLRDEFLEARKSVKCRTGVVNRILVFFGGSDPTNQTERVLNAILSIENIKLDVDVVVGIENSFRERIERICYTHPNFIYHCNISNMASLINAADLAIGAGGSAMWERCYLGLPSITVTFADNQVEVTRDLAQVGAIEYIGDVKEFDTSFYVNKLLDMMRSPGFLKEMSDCALAVVGNPELQIPRILFDRF